MADRKAELERKKAKLEAIRKERQRKEEEKRLKEVRKTYTACYYYQHWRVLIWIQVLRR